MSANDETNKRYSSVLELRGVLRYEWRARRAWASKRAALRGLWWTFVRRYAYELCTCGRPVSRWTNYWNAENSLWADVMGRPGWQEEMGEYAYLGPPGTRCPRCFTALAEAKGIHIYWEPKVDSR